MAWPFKTSRAALVASAAEADALTASVSVVPHDGARITLRRSRDAAWQKESWVMFKQLGEVRFCARYVGNALARVRYFVGTRDHPGDPLVPIPDDAKGDDVKVRDVLERIKGRDGTFASLVRTYGVHRFVAGETFLVGEDGLDGEKWEFLSTSELRRIQRGAGALSDIGADADMIPRAEYERDKQGNNDWVEISGESLVLRFWCRDPEYRERADSPLRPVLDICESLITAGAMQTAGDRSRLATMGLFLVPAEADLPKAPVTDNPGHPAQPPRLMLLDSLQKAMEVAMENPGSVGALSPILVEVKTEYIDKFQRITFDREVDKTIVARIDHLIRRFSQGVDLPPEILLGVGDANHWCTDEASEILTIDGWRTHDQVAPGTIVLTLNHETGLSEWQPITAMNRWQVEDQEMIRIDGKGHSSLTTPNHRWPVLRRNMQTIHRADGTHTSRTFGKDRTWRTSDELNGRDFLITAAPCADIPTDAKYEDAFVEAVAWLWTEGELKRGSSLQGIISQSHRANPANVARITRTLTSLFGPPGEDLRRRPRAHGNRGPAWSVGIQPECGMTRFRLNQAATLPIEQVAPGKRVSLDFIRSLTAAQLELFIDVAVLADGTTNRNTGQRCVYAKHREDLDALELALILTGRSAPITSRMVDGFKRHELWRVGVCEQRVLFGPRKKHIENERYTGTIWCPTTSNGSWYMRREGNPGTFTANSAWAISEEAIAAHITPAAAEFTEDLTVGYLHPTLEEMKIEDIDRYAIGFDVTDLIVSPDRAQHAITLYDKWEMGADHLLEALGFDPSVRPDMDEIIRRILITRASNPRNPDPGPDFDALLGKAPPPSGAERPVPGQPQVPINQPTAEPTVEPGAGAKGDGKLPPEAAGDENQAPAGKNGQQGQTGGKGQAPAARGKQTPAPQKKGEQQRGQQNQDGSKTDKKAPVKKKGAKASAGTVGAMVRVIDLAVDQALTQPNAQAITDARNWASMRSEIVRLGMIDMDVTDKLVEGVMTLARAAKANPAMDIAGAAQILVEAAWYEDDLDDDDEDLLVPDGGLVSL